MDFFKIWEDLSLGKAFPGFLIQTDSNFRISKLNNAFSDYSGEDPKSLVGTPVQKLFELFDPEQAKMGISFGSVIRINPKNLTSEIQNRLRNRISNYFRLHCNVNPIKNASGFLFVIQLLFHVPDNEMANRIKDLFIILDEQDRVIDCNETTFLKFSRVLDPQTLLGIPVTQLVNKKAWQTIKKKGGQNIQAAKSALNKKPKWILEYGKGHLDFKKDWSMDPNGHFNPFKTKIQCKEREGFSYFILNKPLLLSSNDYKIDFTVSCPNPAFFSCILFGKREPKNFSPDQDGYNIGLWENKPILKRKGMNVQWKSKGGPSWQKIFSCSLIFRAGAIQFWIDGKNFLEFLDPLPIKAGPLNSFFGFAFAHSAVFSNLSIYSCGSATLESPLEESETILKLNAPAFNEEHYQLDLHPGDYNGQTASFLFLNEITSQILLKQIKEKAEQQANLLKEENLRLQSLQQASIELIGQSQAMHQLKSLVNQIADSEAPILILGETGTGKGLTALQIHRASRRLGPFLKVDCAAIPSALLESELFGHEKGAFTGAVQQHRGFIERAHTGTLFLDEIGNLSLNAQMKLLQILQDHSFTRVGGEQQIRVDIRIIAATHSDLSEMMQSGQFRKDLFFRLNTFTLDLPQLKNRKEDIPLIVHDYLKKKSNKKAWEISSQAIGWLQNQPWPGNVRELLNSLDSAMVFSSKFKITLDNFSVMGHSLPHQDAISKAKKRALTQTDFQMAENLAGGTPELIQAFLDLNSEELKTYLEKYGSQMPEVPRPQGKLKDLKTRHFKILGLLYRNSPLKVSDLLLKLKKSRATIWRDLRKMESTGLFSQQGKGPSIQLEWANP